jgi:hypothetical protein
MMEMVDENTHQEWDKAVFRARQGDYGQLAAFLRKHRALWPATDIDPSQLADLLEGKLRRPRGKPSGATKKARSENVVLRAADSDAAPLVDRLEALHVEHDCDVPHLRLLAEVVRGDYKRSRGPYPGSRIAQALDAWDIVKQVREAQEQLRREHKGATLPDAWEEVGKKIHKSEEWVRDEYYKMHRHHAEPPSPADEQVLEGVDFVDDDHLKLPDETVVDDSASKRKRRKSP